jgi:hypothetical protein
MIENDHVGSVQSVHLMSKKESPLSISIIGNYKPLALLGIIALSLKHLAAHH